MIVAPALTVPADPPEAPGAGTARAVTVNGATVPAEADTHDRTDAATTNTAEPLNRTRSHRFARLPPGRDGWVTQPP